MKKIMKDTKCREKRLSRQELKNLRRAQARQRIEVLQEAKLLHDHLAEFWDESEGVSKRRTGMDVRIYEMEMDKIFGPATENADVRLDRDSVAADSTASCA